MKTTFLCVVSRISVGDADDKRVLVMACVREFRLCSDS